MHLTFRLINSFDYSTVFYVPVVLQGDQTLSEAIAAVHAAVAAGGGYRPIRHRLALYDTIRLYWSPGLIKATDRIFDTTRGENLNVEQHAASTITQLGFGEGDEISFFCLADYERWHNLPG